jgi:pilus assembly protein CpaF
MEYLNLMVKSHRNLVVSGGVSTGKTSLLNALSTAIDSRERVIVIEDSSELKLNQPHVLYLEAGQRDSTGKKTVTIRDLFVDSLRMRPDRIMVGEVRRGEALDLVQSMLSGHDGAMTTVHASNPFLALVRLETLCLMSDVHMPVYVARTQVASAVHVVVQVSRLADGSRRITGISEVLPLDAKDRYRLRPIFRFVRRGTSPQGRVLGELEPTGKPSRYRKELRLSEFTDEIRLSEAIFPVG